MLKIVTAIVLASLQAPSDPLLAKLAGRWSGDGTVLNTAAHVHATWEPTLDGRFFKLTFVNQMGARKFEGHAYYRALGNGSYRGTWFDNSGMVRPIEARADGDAMVATWGTPDTEVGETTYRLLSDRTMEIVDRVRSKDGTWRDFGRVRLSRD